jgi:aryl-alcohol dehydrogenase-like predicted oxidoreductase
MRDRTGEGPLRSSRRAILAGGLAAAAGALSPPLLADEKEKPQALPRRPFGRTGEEVTLFALGCFPLGGLSSEEEGARVALAALEAGCNYFDTAPSYSDGKSERALGRALKEFRGARPLVATKTLGRTADQAQRDLEGSLVRLGVERVDLVQIHAVRDAEDLARVLDRGQGPLAALERAREQKLLRWIGVTGHFDPETMRGTFARYDFDAILFPLNCVDPHYRIPTADGEGERPLSFLRDTLPAAVEKGLARLAMKVFASGSLPKGGLDARECLRFSYGLDVSACVVGCRTVEEVALAADVARAGRFMDEAGRKAFLERSRGLAGSKSEWYKRR